MSQADFRRRTRSLLAATPVTPVGGGLVRTDSSFLSAYPIKKGIAANYGGDPTGVSDSTAAVLAAINGISNNEALEIDGVFKCALVAGGAALQVANGASRSNWCIYGNGPTSRLQHYTDGTTALRLASPVGATLRDFFIEAFNSSVRTTNIQGRGIHATTPNGLTIYNVVVDGVTGAGMLCDGGSNVSFLQSSSLHTLADSFHFTGGLSTGLMQFLLACGGGDDSFASIGYSGKPTNDNIQVLDCQAYNQTHGGTLGIEGTTNYTARRVRSFRSAGAAMRIQALNAYTTLLCDHVDVQDCVFEESRQVTTGTSVSHPVILLLVSTPGQYVHNFLLKNNQVINPNTSKIFQVQGLSATENVQGEIDTTVVTDVNGTSTTMYQYASIYHTLIGSGNTFKGVTSNPT